MRATGSAKTTKIDEILRFWFDGLNDDSLIDSNNPIVKRWFAKNGHFDRDIRQRFEDDYLKARGGEHKSWEDAPPGRLALVILFDQFSRNMYRNTPRMFESDQLALALTMRSLKDGFDLSLPLIQRLFLYMPLMHAEDLKIQKLSLNSFENLVVESKQKTPHSAPYFEYSFGYAQKHHDIIATFGRFPHRNAALNRPSTPPELAFLKKSGSSF